MPSEKQHLKKALHNEKFFDDVKHEYQDWAMTGLFYAVLHYIEAYLATKGIHVEDHKERAKQIGLLAPLKLYMQTIEDSMTTVSMLAIKCMNLMSNG